MIQKALVSKIETLLAPYGNLGGSLWSMFFATMINRFGDFVGPFLALYLSRVLGFDEVTSGLFAAITFGAATVGALLSGRIADFVGRKRSLLACHLLAAVFNFAMGFLYDLSWAPLLIVAGAFFRGGARPLIGALLTDLAPPERRKEVFGLQYWSINVGVAVGPIAAAFLFSNALPWLFRGDALFTLASAVLIFRGVHVRESASRTASSLERRDERGALRAFLSRPILLAFSALALANSVTYSQTGFGLPLTFSDALGDRGPSFYGFMISLNAVTVIALSIPIASLLRSRSPLLCMALSGGFYVLGFGMLVAPLSPFGFAVSTFIWTLGEIVAAVNLGVFIARHSPENWRGSFQSFVGVFFSAGWSIGPLIAGPLLHAGGPRLLWTMTAALCALWALGSLFVDRLDRELRPESEPEAGAGEAA